LNISENEAMACLVRWLQQSDFTAFRNGDGFQFANSSLQTGTNCQRITFMANGYPLAIKYDQARWDFLVMLSYQTVSLSNIP
jgi:hypothetical protein